MCNLGNKEVFGKNLSFYVEHSGKTKREVANALGVAPSTFNEWTYGKKYPRIDKIEMLADYFGILKSDLIEDKSSNEAEGQNDVLATILVKIRMNEDLLEAVETLCKLEANKISSVKQMLKAFAE